MQANRDKVSDYIFRFLLGKENEEFSKFICYGNKTENFEACKLQIIPSHFFDKDIFGTEKSLPILPLSHWEDIPLLFGSPKIEQNGEKKILYADIVASTFFLISRYEESVNRHDRDEHGRFPGNKSLPFRGGFLQRPIVDEYGSALRKLLREIGLEAKEPNAGFNKIYLTHDADQIAHYRNFRGMGGAICRFFKNPFLTYKAIQSYFGGIKYDPWFNFPWFFENAKELKQSKADLEIENVVFIKPGGGKSMADKPLHNISDGDFSSLFRLCKDMDAQIGLHPSYLAGDNLSLILTEKQLLDEVIGKQITYSRNHFLRSKEPEDFYALIEAGLTDDFTMTYADVGGFRLGTCKAVRWINPVSLEISLLTLHATTMMDSTLNDERYMKLRSDDAFSFAKKMIDTVKKHHGDLVLLWHNTSVEKDNGQYHRELYKWMIHYLKN